MTLSSINNQIASTKLLAIFTVSQSHENKKDSLKPLSKMASQALVLATNSTLQPHQPTTYQEHSSTLHQQPSSYQPQPPTCETNPPVSSNSRKRRSTPGGGLKKGLDTLTKCIERKIDQQILQAQSRAHGTSSQPVVTADGGNKKVHWEEHSHAVQVKV